MKQFLVLGATVLLGLVIVGFIVGSDTNSMETKAGNIQTQYNTDIDNIGN